MESRGFARSSIRYFCLLIIVTFFSAGAAVPVSAGFTLTIYEQTGSINAYSFNQDDDRIFTDLPGLPGPRGNGLGGYDFGTGGCEFYDIFFCNAEGTVLEISPGDPLPLEIFVKLECYDVSCNSWLAVASPNWVSAGNNVDAVMLNIDGQIIYAQAVVEEVYGLCDEPFEMKTSNFASSALGPPDAGITKMGCGWTVITLAMGSWTPPPPPAPLILSVEDVGNDSGRQVRLKWQAAPVDIPGSEEPVTGYALWRRIDPLPEWMIPLESVIPGPSPMYPPGDWDYIGTVPACCEETYSTIVPTLADAVNEEIHWSVFFVRALTGTPEIYFDSLPDSGYSVCDIFPPDPDEDPEQQPSSPDDYLGSNYPNPFNPNTTIAFGLKESGHVSLRVYDAAGRLVSVLIDESRSAGPYVTVWKGNAQNGSPAASGVYFYRLISKEFDEKKKMILLR